MRSLLPVMTRPRNAFSLVEVVLALGVIVAVFIPLLGLLSGGLAMMKESNVDVKTSLIAQKFLAAAQMVPYAKLAPSQKFLDYDGNEVSEANSVFTVNIVPAPTVNLLGSSNLTRVTVTFLGPGVENRPRIFASSVANLGD